MTEQEQIDALKPGEWTCDNSAHRYRWHDGKMRVRFAFAARSAATGRIYTGLALTRASGESLAAEFAA